MTASVRIAHVLASTAPANSVAMGKSAGSAGSPPSNARVRLAGVTAQAFTASGSTASVRVADVVANAVQTTYVWNGTTWVVASPTGTALSFSTSRSAGSGATTHGSGTASSASKGTSTGSGTVTFSGTATLSGGGSLTPSGGALTSTDKVGEIDLSGGGTLTLIGNVTQGGAGLGSVSVFVHPEASPPYVEIDLAGFLGSTASLTRIDQAGNRTPVRLANPATLDGGAWSGADYEAPFGVPCKYECVASLTQTSDPVVLDVTTPWLIHPGIPTLSQPVVVTAVPQRTLDTNQGTHNVMGRTTPIVVTDGTRRAPTYDLALRTETESSALGLEALLADAQVLLLQIRYAGVTRTFYDWVAVGQVTTQSLTDYFGDDLLNWTLAITVTTSPDDANQGERTLAALAAEFSTLGEIALNYSTLADIIADNLIGS